MADFLARNPFVVLCGLTCVWPGVVGAIGWWLGRHGTPVIISIRRRNNGTDGV